MERNSPRSTKKSRNYSNIARRTENNTEMEITPSYFDFTMENILLYQIPSLDTHSRTVFVGVDSLVFFFWGYIRPNGEYVVRS